MQKANITKPTLFVSHSKRGLFYYNDASARYRCIFPAEEIIANGGQAHAIHISQIDKVTLSDYKTIVFHRPQHSAKLKRAIKEAKKEQIETWVDFDDLLFCPELSESSAAVQSGKMSTSVANKHAKRYAKALALFKNHQVSTDELADQLALHLGGKLETEKRIKISYNKIPERWVKQAEFIPAEERLKKKIIRYLPGTSHHKHDFAHIETFLATLLHNNPSYHLNVIGELEFDHDKFPKDQISTTPFQPYEQLPGLINDSWIIIAPLVDNIFNRCKSGLKFWESGVFGIPVISSPLRDMERLKNPGLCTNESLGAWEAFIEQMENPNNYQEASQAAYQTALQSVFTQPKTDHRKIFLALASEFGPRWSGKLLNPASPNNPKIKAQYEKLINAAEDNQNQEMPYSSTGAIIKYEKPTAKNSIYRKTRKLFRSPKDFIKDSKYLKFLISKN